MTHETTATPNRLDQDGLMISEPTKTTTPKLPSAAVPTASQLRHPLQDEVLLLDWQNVNGKLYEKSDQIEQLRKAYHRQTKEHDGTITSSSSFHHRNELFLITGPSGAGKTVVALTLQEEVEEDGGFFCRGKFHQPTHYGDVENTDNNTSSNNNTISSCSKNVDSGHGPFATAVSQWASSLILSAANSNPPSDDRISLVQTALERELDTSELQVLAESVPALQPILHHNHHNKHLTITSAGTNNIASSWRGLQGPDAELRYNHIFSKFVRAICCSRQPLVLLLDDLQWADRRSLQLLKTILTYTTTTTTTTTTSNDCATTATGLLIIGTVRSDEGLATSVSSSSSSTPCSPSKSSYSSHHLLVETLDELQSKDVIITSVQVSNLSQGTVTELVSDLLHLSVYESKAFSQTIFHRTKGNTFFMFQLLKFLEGEGRLQPYASSNECTSSNKDNHNGLQQKEGMCTPHVVMPATFSPTTFSVLDLIASKIQQLPHNVQEVLKMASCFGPTVSERLLTEAGSVGLTALAVQPALAIASDQGLIAYDRPSRTVTFVHDVIQQAAYSLIESEHDRASLHLHIGRALWIWLPHEELDQHLFLVTNQITRGLHLINDQVEKVDLAELFLRAGHKAALSSAFSQASNCYSIGIRLLGKKHWRRHYRLSLGLYNAAAEMEYYGGNLARVDTLLNSVLKHATSLDDKLHAYCTQMYSQASRDDFKQAFSIGLEVLKQLGVTFPDTLCKARARLAWVQCRSELRRISDESIMQLPLLRDNRQLMVIRLLNTLMLSAFSARQELVVPMVMQMVHHTLQHGICGASTYFTFSLVVVGKSKTRYR